MSWNMTNLNERLKTSQNIFQLLLLRRLLEGLLPFWHVLLACTCASRIAEETLLKGCPSLTGVRMCQQNISDVVLKTRHSDICFNKWAEGLFTGDYYLLSDVVKNGSINSIRRICAKPQKEEPDISWLANWCILIIDSCCTLILIPANSYS